MVSLALDILVDNATYNMLSNAPIHSSQRFMAWYHNKKDHPWCHPCVGPPFQVTGARFAAHILSPFMVRFSRAAFFLLWQSASIIAQHCAYHQCILMCLVIHGWSLCWILPSLIYMYSSLLQKHLHFLYCPSNIHIFFPPRNSHHILDILKFE